MTTTTATKTEVSTKDIFQFIKLYRAFEDLTLKLGYILIRDALKKYPGHEWQIDHLCDHWRYKERGFGVFWLNLDSRVQMWFIKYWGFNIEGDEFYLMHIEKDASAALFLKPPAIVQAFHNIILFFSNHAIDESTAEKIDLPALPKEDKQFGNATNWGAFILSLSPFFSNEQHQLLETIRDYYPKMRLTNQ